MNKGLPRSFEVLLAAGGLAVLFPVLLTSGILVRASSPGPIIFRQRRVGRSGKTFTMYKFRSMTVADTGPLVTSSGDQRITPIGRFLRKWKLDELPELYNVLRGDMSFVGPRPEVAELVDLDDPHWKTVLSVRPGITDPVTMLLRNEETLLAAAEDKDSFYRDVLQPFKINGYLNYVRNKGAFNDLRLIAQTIKIILFPRKAVLSPKIFESKIGSEFSRT